MHLGTAGAWVDERTEDKRGVSYFWGREKFAKHFLPPCFLKVKTAASKGANRPYRRGFSLPPHKKCETVIKSGL